MMKKTITAILALATLLPMSSHAQGLYRGGQPQQRMSESQYQIRLAQLKAEHQRKVNDIERYLRMYRENLATTEKRINDTYDRGSFPSFAEQTMARELRAEILKLEQELSAEYQRYAIEVAKLYR